MLEMGVFNNASSNRTLFDRVAFDSPKQGGAVQLHTCWRLKFPYLLEKVDRCAFMVYGVFEAYDLARVST